MGCGISACSEKNIEISVFLSNKKVLHTRDDRLQHSYPKYEFFPLYVFLISPQGKIILYKIVDLW